MRIDPRAGSGPLLPLLRARGVKDAHHGPLTFGDIAIEGRGPEGLPIQVGVEYKKLPDLLQCMENGRFVGHQLPGMLACYDVIILLVEGIWREGKSGILEVPRGAGWSSLRTSHSVTASALQGFLMTLNFKLGIRVMLTGTPGQTVDWLFHMNRWWTGKEWEEHRAHLSFDNSAAIASVTVPSLTRRLAKELPGVGYGRSGPVSRHFSSPVDMVMADRDEWSSISGIGKVTADRVVRALNGEKV